MHIYSEPISVIYTVSLYLECFPNFYIVLVFWKCDFSFCNIVTQ